MFEYAYTENESRVVVLDLILPGWEQDEQTGTEDSRFVREGDVADADMDDDGFAEAYDAWREDTFDPDFPF